MNPSAFIKPVIEFTIGLGVGTVISNVIKFTTPLEQTCLQKVAVKIGGIVISMAVSTAVTKAALKPFEDIKLELAKAKAIIELQKEQDS